MYNSACNCIKSKLQTCKEFIIFLAQRAKSDTVLRVASSLSYTSLIALVPLVAIGLAIFSAFPVFAEIIDQLQQLLIQNVVPHLEEEISQYFNSFISATAKLTAVGVSGIAITAILLLSTIENSLNFIFKVYKPRSIKTKITLYWTVITLGPLLIGTAFSLRGYIYALENLMPDAIRSGQLCFSALLPNILTIIALVILYVLVPNKKVNVLHAFFGSLVATILFFILRRSFSFFLASTNTYNILYGALAIIPIMLIWLYLVWAAVIFGAVVTAAISEFKELPKDRTKELKVFEYRKTNTYRKNKHYVKK
ncbi:MAG: YihY family inner membrane protein, partial [Alphaproteobacteria bacterium]|nr:YihY family inner membrane protein [Alphaproteobacteria bacterium]